MSVLFESPDYSQDICEICDQLVDTTKPHMCSMRRALRIRKNRMGDTFEPLLVTPVSGVEESPVGDYDENASELLADLWPAEEVA